MTFRSVRLLLVPSKEQEKYFYYAAYMTTRMYNIAIDWNKDAYETTGMFLSKFDMIRMLPDFREANPEFQTIESHTLQIALLDLRKAFDNFRDGKAFPKYKKGKYNQRFGVRSDAVKLFENRVKIPGVKTLVKCKSCHWLLNSKTDEILKDLKIYNPRVVFDGKYWFLTFTVEVNLIEEQTTDEVIGVDLGVKNTAYLSSGEHFENISDKRIIKILERRKKCYQRSISRKYERNKVGKTFVKTKDIRKLEKKVRLITRRINNIRNNYNHQITNYIVSKHPKMIKLEDLNIRGMLRNKHLSRRIQEQQFYRIRQLLVEKARNTLAVGVSTIPRYYPSSKLCSNCGNVKSDLKLSDRIYVCSVCGLRLDRDENAALNIRDCIEFNLLT